MTNIGRLFATVLLLALLPLFTLSCGRTGFAPEGEVALSFSVDTLSFDTVFATIGSTTRQVRVYNRTSSDVLLSEVTLAGGRASRFRINVDGDTSMVARQIEVLAGDSIFIFVQVNVKPNDLTEPFLVEDAILFSNGQRVPLRAWGRNAVYHQVPAGAPYSVVDCEGWDHTRPHVILGTAAILDGHTLNLVAGDELYFADNGMLAVDSNASLVVNGTAERPVLFTSLRHDGWYSFLPGQWQCLFLTSDSKGNYIDHALIENGTGGIRVYPRAELMLTNTVLRNMSDCALIGQGGKIEGSNLLVYDCLSSFIVLGGGSYAYNRCTFANYWRYTSRTLETVVLSNTMGLASGDGADLLRADFVDCIVYGSHYPSELLLVDDSVHLFNYRFDHSLVKGGEWDEDPLFEDVENDNYRLRDESPALGIGYPFEDL